MTDPGRMRSRAARRRAGPAHRSQGAPAHARPDRRQAVPHPPGRDRARRPDRRPRGRRRHLDVGHRLPGAAPAAGRLRPVDAARRRRRLPEGRRADRHARPTSTRERRVVEAGAGSGALTCSLLRAVGPERPGDLLRAARRPRRGRRAQRRHLLRRAPGRTGSCASATSPSTPPTRSPTGSSSTCSRPGRSCRP